MRIGLVVVLLLWAAASLASVPPLDRVIQSERAPWILVLLPIGVGAYAFAAWRYLAIYRERRRPLPLAVAVAFVFLAEALIAMAFGRAWHASWWEWHVLMAVAFATIVLAARQEYRRAPSLTGTFGGIYLQRTLERLDSRQSKALAELVRADAGGTLDTTAAALQGQGFTSHEVAVMTDSARELTRMDGVLRQYVGPQLADRLGADPEMARLGGTEHEVSVLFADLSGFTAFAEGRSATEVIDMLNAYWGAVVPFVVDEEGGFIERFAGDAILAVFNALGDQPDHASRAVRAAIAVRDRSAEYTAIGGMAAVPRRREHRSRGDRQRRGGAATLVRGDRRHDERRRSLAGTFRTRTHHDRQSHAGRGGGGVGRDHRCPTAGPDRSQGQDRAHGSIRALVCQRRLTA